MRNRSRSVVGAVLAAAVAAALAAGCGDRVGTADAAGVDLAGRWHLVAGSDERGRLDLADREVTLFVDGDEVSGTSACNQYFGTVAVDGDTVDVSGLGGTEMACEPPVMDLEQRYLAALAALDRAVRTGDELALEGPDVSLRLSLAPPVRDAPLTGTVWRLESLIEGETVSSVSGDGTLTFREDGTFEGSTGCRELRGEYTVDDGTVSVDRLEVGPGGCPDELRRQHRHVVDVLGGGFAATVDGTRLTLVGKAGKGLAAVTTLTP